MDIRLTASFERDYRQLSSSVQKIVDKKLLILVSNFKHPSLRTKKMEGYENIWEIRLGRSQRLTFSIVGKVYFIRRVGAHDILRKP